MQTQISKGQALLQNQEKPDLAALTQEVQTSQKSYDTQLAQVSVMEKGLKDATATYQAAKNLQDSNQEAFKAHQELSDLTGSERSVKSLSGGETFIAALAIALSLSEVVQNTSKGAVVEALFIDEGFGSLDKEALTKAITVLEQIGENRMVGVISHVDDMKEGIAQQLAIIKSHDGSSRIKIVDKG